MHAPDARFILPAAPADGSPEGSIVLPAFRARHASGAGRLKIRYTRSSEPALGLPTVVVLGGISASADVITLPDGTPGWWSTQVGDGCAIDTAKFDVISMDFICGHDIDGADCRHVTTEDQADALAALLDALHVPWLHAVVGASYGAMVALAFAARYPENLARLLLISGAHKAHPRAIALRSIQRRIIELGQRAGETGTGIALARSLAITSYRSHEEFAARFGAPAEPGAAGFRFPVEEYLEYNGNRFAATASAARYLQLSESLDLHDVNPTGVTTPTTLVAADPDFLVPITQMQELSEQLGGFARLHILRTAFGHDAFLKETQQLAPLLRESLCGPLNASLTGVFHELSAREAS